MTRHEAWPNTHFVLEYLDLETLRKYPNLHYVNRFLIFQKKTASGRRNIRCYIALYRQSVYPWEDRWNPFSDTSIYKGCQL